MSEVINPSVHPEHAAQQVIIELIRANALIASDDGVFLLKLYDKLKNHYESMKSQADQS